MAGCGYLGRASDSKTQFIQSMRLESHEQSISSGKITPFAKRPFFKTNRIFRSSPLEATKALQITVGSTQTLSMQLKAKEIKCEEIETQVELKRLHTDSNIHRVIRPTLDSTQEFTQIRAITARN